MHYPRIHSNASKATDTNYSIPAAGPGQQSQQASSILDGFKRKREAAAIAVPTSDERVRIELRSRGEPITLFGERPEDRRDRLRQLLYFEQQDDDTSMVDATPGVGEDEEDEEVGEFYIEGSGALLDARRKVARYSLPRAAERVKFQKLESTIAVATHVKHRNGVKRKLESYELYGSQIASERPMSLVRFAPKNDFIACGDWGGSIKILDVPNLETKHVLRGHKGMVGGIDWMPDTTVPSAEEMKDATTVQLASGGGEGSVFLWNTAQETPIATLNGHTSRVVRTVFHPSSQYLASASYDTTWRLWDLPTQSELLLQEGHSKEVYAIAFNQDGSLLASAGLDSIGRVWDLRTGRTVMLLEGHVGPIYAVDWSVDGYRCVTGSADGFAKVWDLRQVRETASIGAHKGGVSDLRWFKGVDGPLSGIPLSRSQDITMTNGDHADADDAKASDRTPKKAGTFFVSAGFDKALNVFSADDWSLCKSLTGHDGTVLSCDVDAAGKWVASCGRDRTVKVWAMESADGVDGI
jgi:U4/U6 small nuclear ribonucleoprotein PRP4